MTEEVQDSGIPSELETLKKRADMMGIKYHHNEGVTKLKAKINNALKTEGTSTEEIKTNGTLEPPKKGVMMTYDEYRKWKKERRKKDAGKLVRVRITCMNPLKKDWDGEIFSVGSAKIGTFKRYIPYNQEWHVPYIMFKALQERKCSIFHTVKDQFGAKVRKSKLVPEFSIERLPPLTKEQLKDLAKQQAMAGSIDNG